VVGASVAGVFRPLVAYAFLARGFVVLVAVLATRLQLGTHYDVSPLVRIMFRLAGSEQVFVAGSWSQLFWLSLVPQLVVWPVYTVGAGLVGGFLAWRWVPQTLRHRSATPVSAEALASSSHADD
jgi:hypothetical protein